MKPTILMLALFSVALAHAKDQKARESGTLLQMDSVECGADEKSGKSFAGEISGCRRGSSEDSRATLPGVHPKN
jgi:hypothetical protein